MPRTRASTISFELIFPDGSAEILADVEFSVVPYVPARGPSYASGGEPAEGGYAEDVRVTRLFHKETRKKWSTIAGEPPIIETIVTDLDCPPWLAEMIEENADCAALYEEAETDERNDRADYEYERRRDDRMED